KYSASSVRLSNGLYWIIENGKPMTALNLSDGTHAYAMPGTGSVRPKDRKSTRLNSSHGSISYAVFCLKKKNETRHPRSSGLRESFPVTEGLPERMRGGRPTGSREAWRFPDAVSRSRS